MRKVNLKTGKLEIIFSIFLLLFALEPLFGSVPAADNTVWGLIVLCVVLMVVLMIKDLVKDARGFLSRYTSRSVLSVLDIVICLIGVAVSYAVDAGMNSFWILMLFLTVIAYFLPAPKGAK